MPSPQSNFRGTLDAETERIATLVMDAIFAVHRKLGAGLLESLYEEALCCELTRRGLSVIRQKQIPVMYDGIRLSADLRLDLVVENRVIVEVKAVESLLPVHKSQLLTYMKLSGLRLGFLVNFNVPLIKNGLHRFVR